MTEDELLVAMRHGADNLERKRLSNDLEKLGAGLKTASFSLMSFLDGSVF